MFYLNYFFTLEKQEPKIVVIFLLLLVVLVLWSSIFLIEEPVSLEEQKKIELDEYNFEQLEKVKAFLENTSDYKFRNLYDFNRKFDQNIQPIKNCYYLISTNFFENKNYYWNGVWYIFWFKLESEKYINKYWTRYYIYPKNDFPTRKVCYGSAESCSDWIFDKFDKIISNPCRD